MPTKINCVSFSNNGICSYPGAPKTMFGLGPSICIEWLKANSTTAPKRDVRLQEPKCAVQCPHEDSMREYKYEVIKATPKVKAEDDLLPWIKNQRQAHTLVVHSDSEKDLSRFDILPCYSVVHIGPLLVYSVRGHSFDQVILTVEAQKIMSKPEMEVYKTEIIRALEATLQRTKGQILKEAPSK